MNIQKRVRKHIAPMKSYPIAVRLQFILLYPSVAFLFPYFHQIVATAGGQSLNGTAPLLRRVGVETGVDRGTPTDRVAPDRVGVRYFLRLPSITLVREDGDRSIRASAGQDQTELVRRPRDRIDRRVVTRVFVHLCPFSEFFPDNYFPAKVYARALVR